MHSIETFSMPRYHEIPNVGLYLKQVVKYINDCLNPYFRITVTETMLSNYVKMHMVPNPVKKQYSRDSIAMLIFITLAKSVLPLEDIQYMLKLQGSRYEVSVAYDYFCEEYENVLAYVYGYKDSMERVGERGDDLKNLLKNMIITIARKFYLEECFRQVREAQELSSEEKE